VLQFYQQLRQEVAALPGVEAVGFISTLPLSSSPPVDDFMIEGRPEPAQGEPDINGGFIMTTPGTFEALGVPLLRGRLLDEHDVSGAPLVAVIDETAARDFWPGVDPIGRRIRYYDDDNAPWLTVVGIVGAVHYISARQAPRPNVYTSHAQRPRRFYEGRDLTMLVRSTRAEAPLSSAIQRIVRQTDPLVPVTRVRGMEEVVQRANIRTRFAAALMSLFGFVALAVGALGVYGILSYLVQTRTNEIGIRMALGADARQLVRQILQQGLVLAGVGIALGSAAALAATGLLSTLLFGVSRTDALTYVIVISVLAGTTLLASWLPARRARVDQLLPCGRRRLLGWCIEGGFFLITAPAALSIRSITWRPRSSARRASVRRVNCSNPYVVTIPPAAG
jgi:putative ABC transport system permease protein